MNIRKNLFYFLSFSILAHIIILFYTFSKKINFEIPEKVIAVKISNLIPVNLKKSDDKIIEEKIIEPEIIKNIPKPAIFKKEPIKEKKEVQKIVANPSLEQQELKQTANQISDTERTNYEQILASWLERYRKYPKQALKKRFEGEVFLWAKIAKNGTLIDYKITSSSKYDILDEAVIEMIQKASPLPKIPDEFKIDQYEFTIPVSFRII